MSAVFAETRQVASNGLLAAILASAAGAASIGWIVSEPWGLRLALAIAVGSFLLGLGLLGWRGLIPLLVVWLAALGLVRRLVSEIAVAAHVDFLLLIAPLGLLALLIAARARGAFVGRTALSTAVAVTSGLIVVGALNPMQGSLMAGLAGLLFVLVPPLWFWVGRGLCDDRTLAGVFKLVAALGVPAAVYGLSQTFVGFPPWDDRWIRDFGYAALDVHGHTRAFASFSAAAEYATFLGAAIVAWLGFGLRLGWIPLTSSALAVLAAAVFYESSRGTVFTVLLALGLMVAARHRFPLPAAAAAAALAMLLVPFVASRVSPETYASGSASGLVSHQLAGLANPLDPQSSTLLTHLGLVAIGLDHALSHPLGVGVGAVNIAADKFGAVQRGTETDPSNVATALGVPGLAAYVVLFLLAFRIAYRVAAHRRDPVALVALGVLAVTIFQWLNGGQYAVAPLPWLALGWFDRQRLDVARPPDETPNGGEADVGR
ncbi:MAG TPA: hypothetical protein VHF67_12465 [Gaiellaceae bacterium]|jgi:hypothetical protein|nr:hypothetical protein [Gaiellaceae bacterium]